MATSAGELIYTVGMDTKGLLSGAREASSAIEKVSESADKSATSQTKAADAVSRHIEALRLEAATAKMSAQQKELYVAAINGATAAQLREISSLRDKITASRQAASAQANGITALRGYNNVLNNAVGSNNRFRGGVQQAGYQIQDLVVQLQMGTSAFVAIGQQGSQLAGAFGPGGAVIGAVIALGSALLGLAFNAAQAKADLTELAAAGDRIANLRLDTLVKINDASRDLTSPDRISKYKQLGGQILDLTTAYENQQLTTKRLREEAQKAQDALQDVGGFFGKSQADATAELAAKNKELNESLRQEAEIRSRVNGIQKQQQDLYDEEAKIKSDAEKATKKASRESESAAKKDLTLREQNNARINDAKLKTQQLTIELSNLKNGTEEITGATSRYSIESATLAAQQQLNKDATKQQVAALAEQILAQQRINEEIANQSKISKQTAKFTEFVTEIETDATLKADDPTKTETKKHLANLKRINAFSKMEAAATVEGKRLIHQAEVEEETRHQKELAQIRQDALLSSLEFVSSSTNNILTMLSDAGKESSAMYKILFAAQKAAAIPSMLVATEEGATKALALGPIAGPAMAGVIRGLGYASMGVVAGQAIAGARQFGGPTDAGMYRVGENNQPEIYQSGGASYLISGDRGRVTPMSEIGSGGGFQQTVNVHNNSGANVSTRTSPDGKQMDIIINEIASQVENRRGRFARAMTSGTNTKFKSR